MKSAVIESDVQISGEIPSIKKGFTVAANANIFDILSNKLYENPIEAIVRELYSNAIDANLESGSTAPIEVVLPTAENPILSIKDHGIGMSDEKVADVFTQYGNSTKNADNNQIGGFGIGGKTPFAYTDQFTIESSFNGVKTSYVAIKEETGPSLITTASQSSSETGTTVSVPIKSDDISAFNKAAVKVFLFAIQFPEISEASKEAFESAVADCGWNSFDEYLASRNEIASGVNYADLKCFNTKLIALIGGVMYTIDTAQIKNWRPFLEKKTCILRLEIGSLSVQASREKLNYDQKTIKTINDVFKSTVQSIFAAFVKDIENPSLTYLDRHKMISDFDQHDFDALVEELCA